MNTALMNIMQKQILIFFCLILLIPSVSFAAGMYGDFENDWSYNATGHNDSPTLDRNDGWQIFTDSHGVMSISKDTENGMNGGSCCKVDVTNFGEDGTFKVYNQYHPQAASTTLPELDENVDMFVWYMRWPDWRVGEIHLGPESEDPDSTNADLGGMHYYHYFDNIVGSPNYWIQFIADMHPQHTNASGICGSGWDCNDPSYDPEPDWNYIHGWRRTYIQFRYNPWGDNDGATTWPAYGPYSVYLDKQEFIDNPYPDNHQTVNSKATAYYGNGHFVLHWSNDSNYLPNSDGTNRWGYEIRWSRSPITNQADYDNATRISDASEPYWDYCQTHSSAHSSDGHYDADFTLSEIEDGNTIYFAIAEVRRNPSDGFDSWAFQIVPFGEINNTSDVTPPISPSGLIIN